MLGIDPLEVANEGKVVMGVPADCAAAVLDALHSHKYGKMANEIVLPLAGSVSGFGAKKEDKFVFFTMVSYTSPATIYRYDIPTKKINLFRKPEIDFPVDEFETKQIFYNSKDGTRIPMFIHAIQTLPSNVMKRLFSNLGQLWPLGRLAV